MKKIISTLLFSVFLTSYSHSSEGIEGATRPLYAEKVKFENHSYIHFTESWPSSTSIIIHDPECSVCVKDKLFLFSEIMSLHEKEKLSKKKS